MMLSEEQMRRRMRDGWHGGRIDGTVCGRGSTIASSINAMNWLPEICEKYNIKTICDAGAGDLHWMKHVKWKSDVDYTPYDLVPRHSDVIELDITTQNLPKCDLILCRFVLNHLCGHGEDQTRVMMALERFIRSGKYLAATNFRKRFNRNRQFVGLNLVEFLGEPIESIKDGHEDHCTLSLWELQ